MTTKEATVTVVRQAPGEHDPIRGVIKFYDDRPERKFGFIETAHFDLFFCPRGYRKLRGIPTDPPRVFVLSTELPDNVLQPGVEVLVLHHTKNLRKGSMSALAWTIPSLNVEQTTLYSVVVQETRTSTTEPVCDQERRMWKTHTETFIRETVMGVYQSKETALLRAAEYNVPGRISTRVDEVPILVSPEAS